MALRLYKDFLNFKPKNRNRPNGVYPFFLLLDMILLSVLIANTKWKSLNFTMTTSVSPSKKCTRKQCPNLVESVLLHELSFL